MGDLRRIPQLSSRLDGVSLPPHTGIRYFDLMNADWIEHRREDGERIGWIRMVGEHFVAVDVLGREITG